MLLLCQYTLQHTATHRNTLQHTTHCNTQLNATHDTLQHTTHCNRQVVDTSVSSSSYFIIVSVNVLHISCVLGTTHCNTLQHIATHCNTLQHTAPTYSDSHLMVFFFKELATAKQCNTMQHNVTHCNALQHAATHCNTRRNNATHSNTLQHTITHCNTLQHTATTYCNMHLTDCAARRNSQI